jgi:hypothetical protein
MHLPLHRLQADIDIRGFVRSLAPVVGNTAVAVFDHRVDSTMYCPTSPRELTLAIDRHPTRLLPVASNTTTVRPPVTGPATSEPWNIGR